MSTPSEVEAYKFRIRTRLMILLAIALLLTGWGSAGLLGIRAVKLGTGLQLIEAPGSTIVELGPPGVFTIYHEFQGVMHGQYYFQGGVARALNVAVSEPLTSHSLPLTSGDPTKGYRFGARRSGELAHVTIPAAGKYRITASYEGDMTTQTMLAIGDGRERTITKSLVAMWMITLLSTAVAAALAVYAFTRKAA